ncbi:hypothetical protein J2X36_002526 [Methylobacterium sp. BE186]|uniref:hypothetical protein n=1 Tax=Methylobacterium sp. BE186 TaxID=2817715 RepID=UPI002857E1B6|nr:hypothetical protein [Methylobacterium sp. BE186]MDR7037775.1 hypothetical protein [Methylobacterium sp. BE186]
MKLQDGLHYRTRDGRTAGPVRPLDNHNTLPWEGHVEAMPYGQTWTDDGHFFASRCAHNLDLVERIQRSRDKAIDQVTLADYRRGVARL